MIIWMLRHYCSCYGRYCCNMRCVRVQKKDMEKHNFQCRRKSYYTCGLRYRSCGLRSPLRVNVFICLNVFPLGIILLCFSSMRLHWQHSWFVSKFIFFSCVRQYSLTQKTLWAFNRNRNNSTNKARKNIPERRRFQRGRTVFWAGIEAVSGKFSCVFGQIDGAIESP